MTAPSNPAEVRGVDLSKLKLWFFRDLTDEQRLKLFRLHGYPVEEITSLSFQQLAFTNLVAPSPPIGDTGGVGEAATELLSLLDDYMVVTSLTANDRFEAAVERLRISLAAALVPDRVEAVDGWQSMETAPTNGKHCILAVPEPSGFVYSVQGAYQDGQWNAVHRDNVKPLAWTPNKLLPDHLRPKPPALQSHNEGGAGK